MTIWDTMITKTKSLKKQNVHILNHRCMNWATNWNQFDALQNESELKVNYSRNFHSFCH